MVRSALATALILCSTTDNPNLFTPGQISKTISVIINGDTTIEGNEQFQVTLANRVNCTVVDGVIIGTITNDDASAFQAEDEPS